MQWLKGLFDPFLKHLQVHVENKDIPTWFGVILAYLATLFLFIITASIIEDCAPKLQA